MTALYSINIRIMGKANTSLLGKDTIFSNISNLINLKNLDSQTISTTILGLSIITLIIIALNQFFKTEIGFAIRATGNNKNMIQAQGVNTNIMQLIALALSNGLIALAGTVIAQNQGYADINMGTGAIVCGLASIIIGEVLFKKNSKIILNLIFVVLGAIVYRIMIAIALQLGMNPSDLKLFTSILVTGVLALPKLINLKGEN